MPNHLNELIKEQGKITDITYLHNEHLGTSVADRKAIFDIYCENEKGEKFIVELQKAKQNFFKDRSIFYSTFPIQEQAQKGEWDFELKAVYTIGILDFVFEEDKDSTEYYHHEVKLMDTRQKEVFYDKLTFIYLEMPKFNKTEAELETHFDKWMYVIKNLPWLESRPAKLQEKIFEQAFKAAEIAKFTHKEAMAYETSLKYYRDLKNVIDTGYQDGMEKGKIAGYQDGMEKGKIAGYQDGMEKGKAEGKAEGLLEGEEKGKAEGLQEALARMIANGMSEKDARTILGI